MRRSPSASKPATIDEALSNQILATAMCYTVIDPMSGKKVHVPSGHEEKAMQRALLQYNRLENREIVRKAL